MAELGKVLAKNVIIHMGPQFDSVVVNVVGAIDASNGEVKQSNVCQGPVTIDDGGTKHVTHPHPPSGVSMVYECKTCQSRGPFDKGRKVGDGYQILTKEEIELAKSNEPQASSREFAITIHPREQVEHETLPGGATYYLVPPKDYNTENYCLLRELIRSASDRVAVTVWGLRGKQHMWKLGVFRNSLTLTQLAWIESIRPVEVPDGVSISAAVLRAADAKYLALSDVPFSVETYRDTANEWKRELFEKKDVVAAAGDSSAAAGGLSMIASLQAEIASQAPKKAPRKRVSKKKSPAAA